MKLRVVMASIIVTPWRSHIDLLRVRSWLFPPRDNDGPDMRRKACNQVISPYALSVYLLPEYVSGVEASLTWIPHRYEHGRYGVVFLMRLNLRGI